MDRKRCSMSWREGNEGEEKKAGGLPSLLTTKPPEQECHLLLDDSSPTTAIGGMSNTIQAGTQSSKLADHHTSHTSAEVLSSAGGGSLRTDPSSNTSSQLGGDSSVQQTWPIGTRTQSLPNLNTPFSTSPTKAFHPGFENSFCQSEFVDSAHNRSLPTFPLPRDHGRHRTARTSFDLTTVESLEANVRYETQSAYVQQEDWGVAHDHPPEGITSGVGSLDLSATSSATPFLHTPIQDVFAPEGLSKTATNAGWLVSSEGGGQLPGNFWHPPALDFAWHHSLSGALPLTNESSQIHNPMWGLGQQGSSVNAGEDCKALFGIGYGGQEHPPSAGGTSSLSSSRSMPELTFSSGDPWMTGLDADWMGESLGQRGLLPQGERSADAQTVLHHAHLAANNASANNASLMSQASGYGRTISVPLSDRPSVSTTDGNSGPSRGTLGGTRMEEGSIGSKRRVWYRAPNGQFASATQALSGHFLGDGGGSGSGEGDTQGREGIRRIRRRRKSEEVERKYRCDYDGCEKAYGTLNHLNTHRATNEHGPRLNAVGYRRANAERLRKINEQTASSGTV